MPRALLRVFVRAPGVFPVSAHTGQPVESSLMELQRSATILKALPTYAAATPLHTHPASGCLITPQTAADKEIRFR